jgi:hypothetical protein
MAYCIFLKILRILEEFRKHHHIKISPKSPCVNFVNLGNFQNFYFIPKRIFPSFWPSQPSRSSGLCDPHGPASPGRCPSSSSSWPSTAASSRQPTATTNPWRADQRLTPHSIPCLNSATLPPSHPVMAGNYHRLIPPLLTHRPPPLLTTLPPILKEVTSATTHHTSPFHFPPPFELKHRCHCVSPPPLLLHRCPTATPLLVLQ